jgi:hypothetical protein
MHMKINDCQTTKHQPSKKFQKKKEYWKRHGRKVSERLPLIEGLENTLIQTESSCDFF